MKALVFKGPGQLAVETVPDPSPADGDLLVAPIAIGICGSDVHGYAGETGRRVPGQIMGHEAAARVVDPRGADGWRPGDLLTFNPVLGCGECEQCAGARPDLCDRRTVIGVNAPYTGAFAERMAVPARNAVRLPDGVEATSGALIEPLAVGIHAVRRAEVHEGEDVVVLGAGMIGLVCAWSAARAGAGRIMITDHDERKLAFASGLGLIPVAASASLPDDLEQRIGRRTVDRVIDAVGISETLATALEVTRRQGTISLVGLGAPSLELPAFPLTVEERTLRGSFCYAPDDFAEAACEISNRRFPAQRFIDRRIGLDDAPAAFAGIADNSAPSIKTIIGIAADRDVTP